MSTPSSPERTLSKMIAAMSGSLVRVQKQFQEEWLKENATYLIALDKLDLPEPLRSSLAPTWFNHTEMETAFSYELETRVESGTSVDLVFGTKPVHRFYERRFSRSTSETQQLTLTLSAAPLEAAETRKTKELENA